MRGRLDDIHAAGAHLVYVGNGTPEQAKNFQARYARGAEVYTDPGLGTYASLGMRRPTSGLINLRSLAMGARSFLQGHIQTSVEGDPFQLGGLLAVTAGGEVVFIQINREAWDRPDVDRALAALREDDGGEARSS